MKILLVGLIGLSAFLATAPQARAAKPNRLDPAYQRIAFLGDSITDGFTYPLLLRQTLVDAGYQAPVLINAGVGGDTAAGMLTRLDRDVFAYNPTMVMLSAGINDMNTFTPDQFAANVVAICDRCDAAKIPVFMMTTTTCALHVGGDDTLQGAYNSAIMAIAAKRGYRIADVWNVMNAQRHLNDDLNEPDGWHLSAQGYHFMDRAILDAMGFAALPGPAPLRPEPLPGLITQWKLHVQPQGAPDLTDAAAAILKPDNTWTTLNFPDANPAPSWWRDQIRLQGFSLETNKRLGADGWIIGVATIHAHGGHDAFLNPSGIRKIWVNGKRLAMSDGNFGFHLGGQHVPVSLKRGDNTVVILTTDMFALTCTDTTDCY